MGILRDISHHFIELDREKRGKGRKEGNISGNEIRDDEHSPVSRRSMTHAALPVFSYARSDAAVNHSRPVPGNAQSPAAALLLAAHRRYAVT